MSFRKFMFISLSLSHTYIHTHIYTDIYIYIYMHVRWIFIFIYAHIDICVYQHYIRISVRVLICIHPTSRSRAGCDILSIFKQGKDGLQSEISISRTGCLTKAKNTYPALLFTHKYGKNVFRWSFARNQTRTATSRIRTGDAVFITFDHNRYA